MMDLVEGKVKAALWAKELDASVVEQWTLVKGVYTADPRIVEHVTRRRVEEDGDEDMGKVRLDCNDEGLGFDGGGGR